MVGGENVRIVRKERDVGLVFNFPGIHEVPVSLRQRLSPGKGLAQIQRRPIPRPTARTDGGPRGRGPANHQDQTSARLPKVAKHCPILIHLGGIGYLEWITSFPK
jgi:hypothetical protein